MKKFISFFIFFYTISLFAECYPIKEYQNKLTVIKDGIPKCHTITLSNGEDKVICLETDTIRLNKRGSKIYQLTCMNGKRLYASYPTLNKSYKDSGYKNIAVSNDYISFIFGNKTIFYSIKEEKFQKFKKELSSSKQLKYITDNKILINYYDTDTKSMDIEIFNISTWESHYLKSKYDDIIRKVRKNNSFIVDQFIPKDFNLSNTISDANSSKNINLLFYKEQGSYIIDKNLKMMSYKKIDDSYIPPKSYSDVKNKLVFGNYSILIGLFSIISLYFVYKILFSTIKSFKLPTVTTFFMFAYLIFVYIGATFINIFYYEYEFNSNIYERKDLLLNIWIYSTIGLYLIPMGAYFTKKYILIAPLKIDKFFNKDIKYFTNSNILFYISIFFFSIAILVLFFYLSQLNNIPIFGVFQHLSAEELTQLRSDSSNGFNGKLYRYMIFIEDIPIILLLISFMMKKIEKKWHILFLSLLIFNIFVAIMTLAKSPLINLILLLTLLSFYINKKIRWKRLFIIILILFILLLIMYALFMKIPTNGLLYIFYSPFHRTFIGSITPLFWWQLYVEQYGLFYGASFPNPHNIFPFEAKKIVVIIMNFVNSYDSEIGIVGTMPVIFFAEWLVNFGKLAMLISMFLFGMLIYSIDYIFIRYMLKSKYPIILALYIYIILYFKRYATTTISGIIIDVHLVIPIVLSILMLYIINFSKRNINEV